MSHRPLVIAAACILFWACDGGFDEPVAGSIDEASTRVSEGQVAELVLIEGVLGKMDDLRGSEGVPERWERALSDVESSRLDVGAVRVTGCLSHSVTSLAEARECLDELPEGDLEAYLDSLSPIMSELRSRRLRPR